MSNGDEVSITCGEAAALLIVFVASLSHPAFWFLRCANAAPNRPSAAGHRQSSDALLPTEIMAGSPIRSRDISLGMTRVLMDNCGTLTVLMSPRRRNVGTLDGTRGRAASVPY